MTSEERQEFADKFFAEAKKVNWKGIKPVVAFYLAAHESGYGRGRFARDGNNIFSVTAGASWTGKVLKSVDGKYSFRVYASLADAMTDWVALMLKPRYAAAYPLAVAGDAAGFYKALQRAGYGDPNEPDYAERIIKISEQVKVA